MTTIINCCDVIIIWACNGVSRQGNLLERFGKGRIKRWQTNG
ncbi:hypothetical protein A2U01_0042622, partial [Trifolium medium]|nr:hypothetical protein [Trifolium medium]